MFKKKLSQRLVALRVLNEKTQLEVAKHLGISLYAYQSYEYGERLPKITSIVELAKLYNVTTDYILGINIKK